MAKRPTRLRFTEDDLADSHVKKAADRADKAVDRAEKAADKLASKKAKPKLKLETDAAGSRKAKLRFEKAEFTEIERPSVAKHMASRGAAVTLTSKAHRAVSEYEDDKVKDLERRYREEENSEIHEMVHAANLNPEQLSELLRMFAADMAPKPDTINTMNEEETQNEI